jgi:Cu/Ag efflux protein CusF
MRRVACAVVVASLVGLAGPAISQGTDARSQVVAGTSYTLAVEVVSFDAATRKITLKGPLGGELEGVVSEDVKDVSMLHPGATVSATYYEALAVGVRRTGDEKPLFTAADIAEKGQPGATSEGSASSTKTMTVSEIDLATNTVVFEDATGKLIPTEVTRPEFQAKLKDLKVGDKVDLTYSEAIVSKIAPVEPGSEAKMTMKAGTLVIERGEIVNRVNNTLTIKNEAGRLIRVTVPKEFKFKLNGKDATVYDLDKGMKLTKTALTVEEVSYSE